MQISTRKRLICSLNKLLKCRAALLPALVLSALTSCTPALAQPVTTFARVPNPPGLPEGIARAADGTIYVNTNPGGNAPNGPQFGQPSQIFAYSSAGALLRSFTIQGQDLTSAALPAYGLQAAAFDAAGSLFVLDKVPARVLKINVSTGEQTTYATFPNLPICGAAGADPSACSQSSTDLRPFPNYLAFAPNGDLYVSDFQQALVWRVPRGGGNPLVAFTDIRLDGMGMGANGVQFRDGGQTLVLATSQATGQVPGVGNLFTLNRRSDGTLENLQTLYTSRAADGPDGFAIGASGTIYLNFFLSNQIVVIAPDGTEVRRITTQLGQEIPFDSPASAVFQGTDLLVTNHAVLTRNPLSFAVLRVAVGEGELPLFRPDTNLPPRFGGATGPDGTVTLANTDGTAALTPLAGTFKSEGFQSFSTVASDLSGVADGNSDIAISRFLLGIPGSANDFRVRYDADLNRLLVDGLADSAAPGEAKFLETSAGILDCANTTITRSGNDLRVNWRLRIKATSRTKIPLRFVAVDKSRAQSPVVPFGTLFFAPNAVPLPLNVQGPQGDGATNRGGQVSPGLNGKAAAGRDVTFRVTVRDDNGTGDLEVVRFLLGPAGGAQELRCSYDVRRNLLSLEGVAGSATPGSATRLSDTMGSLNCQNTSVTRVGNELRIAFNLRIDTPSKLELRLYGRDQSRAASVVTFGRYQFSASSGGSGAAQSAASAGSS